MENKEIIKIVDNPPLYKYFHPEDISFVHNKNPNNELKLTNVGLYSISKPEDAEWITNKIIDIVCRNENDINPSLLSIIDGTAGMGGNTISFSKHFFRVDAVEINFLHHQVLKNNIQSLHIKNAYVHYGNILDEELQKKINSDILFLDPPWGGFLYKSFKFFNLKMDNEHISTIIYELKKKYKYIALKAPINLNTNYLFALDNISDFYVFKNNKKNVMLIIMV